LQREIGAYTSNQMGGDLAHIVLLERSGETSSLLKPIASIAPVRWVESELDLISSLEGAGALVISANSMISENFLKGINEQEKLPVYKLAGVPSSKYQGVLYFSEISLLIEALATKTVASASQINYKGARLEIALGRLSKLGEMQLLSQKETALLACLMRKPSQLVSRVEVKKTVWAGVKVSDANLESLVSRLRRRLDTFEISIESVYGGGYVLR